jgi:DNA-binding response OmpR family regulator
VTAINQNPAISALAVGEFDQDRPLLQNIFRELGWRLFEARDRRSAIQYLERHPVQVVIAESEMPAWNWRKVLSDIRRLSQPPQLIVTSRTADDYLWAEVLNIGGFDVLPQPLERDEVERVIASAWRHHAMPPARAAALPAATPIVA